MLNHQKQLKAWLAAAVYGVLPLNTRSRPKACLCPPSMDCLSCFSSLCLCKAPGSACLEIKCFVSSLIKWREILSILLGFVLNVFYLLIAVKNKSHMLCKWISPVLMLSGALVYLLQHVLTL